MIETNLLFCFSFERILIFYFFFFEKSLSTFGKYSDNHFRQLLLKPPDIRNRQSKSLLECA
jgi:hypothetical protein